MKKRLLSAILLSAIFLTACGNTTTRAIETETDTEAELCRQWGNSLATRSRHDTGQTKDEIQAGYATFGLSCPNWKHLIP